LPQTNNGSPSLEAEEDDAQLFGDELFEANEELPFAREIEEVHEIVTCLLRFSTTLRNPAHHDRLKQSAAASTTHFEPYDLAHVRQKFPLAETFLQERLGRTISKHRQYFKYREQHHSKLSEGLDGDFAAAGERPSTIATSLVQSQAPAITSFSVDQDDDSKSVYTATSYALTTTSETLLRPPRLPEGGQDGEPFECPICYYIISSENEQSWR
jgi:hypothetical protein